MSAQRRMVLAAAAAGFTLAAGDARAQLTSEGDLEFGPMPQGSSREIGPTEARAARLEAGLAGPPACNDRPAEIELIDLPAELVGASGTIPLSFHAGSGRIWQASDPGSFVEFDPASEAASVPIDRFPVTIGIGAVADVPASAPVGEYAATAEAAMTFYGPTPVCRPFSRTAEFTISLTVQGELSVVAAVSNIDLGVLLRGTAVDAPADGSGEAEPAPFVVSGPEGLDFELRVTTRDLEHEAAADSLPLAFTGGLFGRTDPPASSFVNGDVIPASEHGGGPLFIRCGFRVEVPDAVREGRYVGDVVLTVEALLQ